MSESLTNMHAMEQSNSNIENENVAENESHVLGGGGAPIIEFTNENGNVRVKERKVLRDGILERLNTVFIAHPYTKQQNVNGGFSLLLGTDSRTGEDIWAHIELTVNIRAPNIDSFSGKPKAIGYDIPNLFGR